jgi:hypothetical protein
MERHVVVQGIFVLVGRKEGKKEGRKEVYYEGRKEGRKEGSVL